MRKKNKYIKKNVVEKLNPFKLILAADELGLPIDVAEKANDEGKDLKEFAKEYHKKKDDKK